MNYFNRGTASVGGLILLMLILISPFPMQAGNPSGVMSARVTAPSVMAPPEVIDLWKNFFADHPDSVYDNPYWNASEKMLYEDPFFSRQFLFSGDDLWDVELEKVTPSGKNFLLHTRFSGAAFKKDRVVVLVASREGRRWKLGNLLPHYTADWETILVGTITFHVQPGAGLNEREAHASMKFVQDLARKTGRDVPSFHYYVFPDPDSMHDAMGMAGIIPESVPGLAMSHRNILLSGNGSAFYPHELAHMLFPADTVYPFVNEGFATWAGGAMNHSFGQHISKLQELMVKNPEISFHDMLSGKLGQQAYYASGAVMIEMAFRNGGAKALDILFRCKDTPSFYHAIDVIFGVDPSGATTWWRDVVAYMARNTPRHHAQIIHQH